MDEARQLWHYPDMIQEKPPIPVWQLYGEKSLFPDILHVERIVDRAAGLNWTIAPHRHLHLHQLFLLISGEMHISLDGAIHVVAAGAGVNVPRGTVHGVSFSAGAQGYVLTLPVEHFPELFGESAETANDAGRPFVARTSPDLSSGFETLAECYRGASPRRKTALRADAALVLCCVIDKAQETSSAGIPVNPTEPRIARFETLVREHLRTRWTVEEYASALAMSARHLSRLCRSATGLSALQFIEAQLIREACRLLVYTKMPIQSVGFHLGFDDPSYFSRTFHRNAGLSPTNYRARLDA